MKILEKMTNAARAKYIGITILAAASLLYLTYLNVDNTEIRKKFRLIHKNKIPDFIKYGLKISDSF